MQGYWLATRDVGLLVGDKGCGVAGGHVERLVERACVLGRGLKGCNVCVCFGVGDLGGRGGGGVANDPFHEGNVFVYTS